MINFSRIDYEKRLGRLLRLPLRLVPRSAVFPIIQGPGRGIKWKIGSGNHGYWLGSYVVDVQTYLKETLTNGCVFYDIGAHAGFFSLIASRLVGNDGRVFSFEPNRTNAVNMKEHIFINEISNIEVIEKAVGNGTGTVFLKEEEAHGIGSHISGEGDYEVEMIGLDDFVFMHGKSRPDLIKMNIEGSELEALKGSARLIKELRPRFVIFTHGESLKMQCKLFLSNFHYVCTSLDRPYDHILFASRDD